MRHDKHKQGRHSPPERLMMEEPEREKIRQILEAAAKGSGIGMRSPNECGVMLDRSTAWTDVEWLSMGMQLGVLPTKN